MGLSDSQLVNTLVGGRGEGRELAFELCWNAAPWSGASAARSCVTLTTRTMPFRRHFDPLSQGGVVENMGVSGTMALSGRLAGRHSGAV